MGSDRTGDLDTPPLLHSATPFCLYTERLLLRDFVPSDAKAMLAYWADPRYQRFNPELENLESTARDLVDRFVQAQNQVPRRGWQLAIVPRDGTGLIGNCGLRVNDADQREANIGYELDPAHWGRGYATEAVWAILAFGFRELGVHRVWAECRADNEGSVRVLEKLGMRCEARFREHRWFRGRWWDTVIYALLDHEWKGSHL